MLSHHKRGGGETGKPSSKSREVSQDISTAVLAKALYSASVLERVIVACFLQLQEIRLVPR